MQSVDPYARAVAALSSAVNQGSRRDAKRALRKHAPSLECISLGAPGRVGRAQALYDIRREPEMVLNNVRFYGEGQLFIGSLRRLASMLMAQQEEDSPLDEKFVDVLIQRCARTSAGADAYSALEQLLGVGVGYSNSNTGIDFVVAPQRETAKAPINVQCILRGNDVHCRIMIYNHFALCQPFACHDKSQLPAKSVHSVIPHVLTACMDNDYEDTEKWMDLYTAVTDATTLRLAEHPGTAVWVRTLKIAPYNEGKLRLEIR